MAAPHNPAPLDSVRERPGGRSERVRGAVLAAAREQLLEQGWDSFSHRATAQRAGVDPATVYRRWPSRGRLAVDALLELAEVAVPMPDTGSVAGDLEEFLTLIHGVLSDERMLRFFRTLSIAAASDDLELRETIAAFWGMRFEQAAVMIDRGIERGELPRGVDSDVLIERLISPLYFRALLSGVPLDPFLIPGAVEAALRDAADPTS